MFTFLESGRLSAVEAAGLLMILFTMIGLATILDRNKRHTNATVDLKTKPSPPPATRDN